MGSNYFQLFVEKYVPMGSNLLTEKPYISTLCLKNQFQGSTFFSKINSRGSIFGGSIFYVTVPIEKWCHWLQVHNFVEIVKIE